MSSKTKWFITFLSFFVGFLIGFCGFREEPPVHEIVRTDTLTTYDTVWKEKPVPVVSYIDRWDTVEVYTVTHDTVQVELPIERKIYQEDSLYRCEISGWRPSLDTLVIYPKTTTITIDRVQRIEPKRWSIGVTAGPSVLVTPNGRIYGGMGATAGVSYRF